MASKRPLLLRNGRPELLAGLRTSRKTPVCLFCSLARPNRAPPRTRRDVPSRRNYSASVATSNARTELEQTLLQLQKHAPNVVNLSRLQLALQGLRQAPGREAVRVAILGLASDGSDSNTTAGSILRLLLADPLKDEEAWEKELQDRDPEAPLIVRLGRPEQQDGILTSSPANPVQEMHISSPELNGHELELLLIKGNPESVSPGGPTEFTEESLLVPAVSIPLDEDRVGLVTTPVHKAIVAADGLMGAVQVSALPIMDNTNCILPVVNMEGISRKELGATFEMIDTALAAQAIRRFRQGPQHGMEYERLLFASNLPALLDWLKSGIKAPEHTTKPAVRKLIASLLQNALASIQAEESRKLSHDLASAISSPLSVPLNDALADWAQKAHAELQDELDLAFTGQRWRKLGWWKLFWRVDDVAMLTNEMLSQRFLPAAEQELVYLTGRIAELGGDPSRYAQPKRSESPTGDGTEKRRLGSGELAPMVAATAPSTPPKWPGHIAFTRRYLQNETIPALQALAQRLVVESIGTTSVASSLAALLYVSSFASSLYEAGAFAALGFVYGLGRMQKKWETARGFWEGEVREEGRKAVRAAEESVEGVLKGDKGAEAAGGEDELEKARQLVAQAEDALARMK